MAHIIERGATQLEIAAVLPHWLWEAIRKKIAQVHGKGINVPATGFPALLDMYQDYLEANVENATAIYFAISENSAPQIPPNANFHRLLRLNLARLNANNATHILELTNALSI